MELGQTTESTASALSAMGGGANGPPGSATNATTNSASMTGTNNAMVNNTISAAADSSDNQPGTPQPQTQQIGVNDQQQQQQQTQQTANSTAGGHNPYAPHQNTYVTASTTLAASLRQIYSSSNYATSSGNGGATPNEMQQQQEQHQSSYPSYLSSYEQFYQQQGQTQSAHNNGGGNDNGLNFSGAAPLYSSNNPNDFKSSSATGGKRYHPYLQTPVSNGVGIGNLSNNSSEVGTAAMPNQVGLPLSSNNGSVSATAAISPGVVSSCSPTSSTTQLNMGGGGNSAGGGNPQSPSCGRLLCKKCGIMCINDKDLHDHITNAHGASPYGSSGYSGSPYIKEELTVAPPKHPLPPQQTGANPNELLDLDSQKMVYSPIAGSMQSIMENTGLHHQHAMPDPIVNNPLHSMHSMQQRALAGWDQTANIGGASGNGSQEGLPAYMQQQPEINQKPNQSPYYSPNQSPYNTASVPGVTNAKHEYPLIKSAYADSQNFVNKSFDPTVAAATEMCQQTPNANPPQPMVPVSLSPNEFPSTTTGPAQEQQKPYRNFEPPTSSSVMPANNITAKAASWKSNEARRPKTYNCTACNKWFTSSGHLKRHYNTTLHKNAVKTSGQPDPATMPISAHHHPARDPNGKASRKGNNNNSSAAAAAAQQQKPPAPVQPPELPRTPPNFGSTTQQQTSVANGGMPFGQGNGYEQQQSYIAQVQSTSNGATLSHSQSETVLNGHPNGLAGPSALITTAALPTLLMSSSHTRGLLNTKATTIKREISAEEDINKTTITLLQSPTDIPMMGNKAATAMLPTVQYMKTEATTVAVQSVQMQDPHQLLLKQELPESGVQGYHLLELEQRHSHNNTPSTSQLQLPLIISHQQYQEQPHLQQQPMVVDIFSQQPQQQTHMLPLPPHSTMEGCSILGINTPPPHSSNMQVQLPLQRTTSTTATIANMDSIHMLPPQHSLLHQLPLEQPEPSAHSMLSNTTTTNMPDIHRNTITTQHMPLPSIIPSYQRVQQPEVPLPLEHTMTYRTTIGNNNNASGNKNFSSGTPSYASSNNSNSSSDEISDHNSLGTFDPYGSTSMFTTTDGQLLQFITNSGLMHSTFFPTLPTRSAPMAEPNVRTSSLSTTQQRSKHETDSSSISSLDKTYKKLPLETLTTKLTATGMLFSPTVSSTTLDKSGKVIENNMSVAKELEKSNKSLANANTPKNAEESNAPKAKRNSSKTNNQNPAKRKRLSSGESAKVSTTTSTPPFSRVLESGRIECLRCGKEFTKACYLTQHNKSFHSGKFAYRCTKCGKQFNDETAFNTHYARHSVLEKPHPCDRCPKKFFFPTDLRRHIDGIHIGLKPHVCHICQKGFCRNDHLRKHIATHFKVRVVSRRTAKKAANCNKNSTTPADSIVVQNQPAQDENNAPISPEMSEQSGEPIPLVYEIPIDVFVVFNNDNQQQQQQHFVVPEFQGNLGDDNNVANDDDDAAAADDDVHDDVVDDDDDDDAGNYANQFLVDGCNDNTDIFRHEVLLNHPLTNF